MCNPACLKYLRKPVLVIRTPKLIRPPYVRHRWCRHPTILPAGVTRKYKPNVVPRTKNASVKWASSTPNKAGLRRNASIARNVRDFHAGTRDCEVSQMPFQHLFHPSTGFRDRVVHYPAQLDLDRQQLGSHPFLDRLAPDDEGAPFA